MYGIDKCAKELEYYTILYTSLKQDLITKQQILSKLSQDYEYSQDVRSNAKAQYNLITRILTESNALEVQEMPEFLKQEYDNE